MSSPEGTAEKVTVTIDGIFLSTFCEDDMTSKVSPTPQNIAPRGLSMSQAAAYWSVSPGTFKKLVREGIAPQPIRLAGRSSKQIFDKVALDRALDAASGGTAA
jgi:predicted DNA-binding transcriptional regulator AlpA